MIRSNLLESLDFTRMNWAAFQSFLDDRLPGNPVVNNEEAIDKCFEELISAIQEVTAASAPKHLPVPSRCPIYQLVFMMKYA
jgi:hypothetical protein